MFVFLSWIWRYVCVANGQWHREGRKQEIASEDDGTTTVNSECGRVVTKWTDSFHFFWPTIDKVCLLPLTSSLSLLAVGKQQVDALLPLAGESVNPLNCSVSVIIEISTEASLLVPSFMSPTWPPDYSFTSNCDFLDINNDCFSSYLWPAAL